MEIKIHRLLVAVAWLHAPAVDATSYASPERQEILSANGIYLLVVDPVSEMHKVYAVDKPDKGLWSFNVPVWHYPFVVSNDGETVAVVSWRHIQEKHLANGDCIAFYRSSGDMKTIGFSEVCPDPPKTRYVGVGPIGDFWRTWYDDVTSDGKYLTIHTTGGGDAKFDLKTCQLVETNRVGWLKVRYDYPRLIALLLGLLIVSVWFSRYRRRKKQARLASVENATT